MRDRVTLNVELKSDPAVGVTEDKLVAAECAAEWAVFSSFHPAAVRTMRAALLEEIAAAVRAVRGEGVPRPSA